MPLLLAAQTVCDNRRMTKIKVDLIGLALMVVVALVGHAIGVPPYVGVLLVLGALGWLGWDLYQDRG